MAWSDPYADAEEYRAAIKPDADDTNDASILLDLNAISRYLEGKLGRVFNQDASDTTAILVPSGFGGSVRIGDYAAVPTSVLLDLDGDGTPETAVDSADFEMHDLDAPTRAEPWPYTRLVATSWGARGGWATGVRLALVGKRGWPAVPAGVKAATIQLTALWRLESPRATARIPEMGGEQALASVDAQRLLRTLVDQYRDGHSWGLA
jgi:hypothetical protein